MERRRFTREFKLEAVKLIKERGVGYVQAARDLGCAPVCAAQLGEGLRSRSAAFLSRPWAAEAGARWLGSDVPRIDQARSAVEQMIGSARHASDVIARIRALSKKGAFEITQLDINKVIDDVIALIRREINVHGVALRLDLGQTATYATRRAKRMSSDPMRRKGRLGVVATVPSGEPPRICAREAPSAVD